MSGLYKILGYNKCMFSINEHFIRTLPFYHCLNIDSMVSKYGNSESSFANALHIIILTACVA